MRDIVWVHRVEPADLDVLRTALELLDEHSELRAVLTDVVATLARGGGVVMIARP